MAAGKHFVLKLFPCIDILQNGKEFRGFESIEYLCECMSMLLQIRQNEEANLYNRVSQIFG